MPARPMPQDLPLEPDLIKVLASDTRREILGQLQERRMTVTELARELDLRKATVHEHLKKLVDAGLVGREEDDRLWVYYELTPEGKRILNPQRTRFYLVIGLGVLAALAGVVALALYLQAGPSPTMDATQTDELSVQLADDRVFEGGPLRLDATFNGTGSGQEDVNAYLVDADSAERLRQGDRSAQGIPLTLHEATSQEGFEETDAATGTRDADAQPEASTTSDAGGTQLATDARVPAGTYYVFVRSDAGADNLDEMPAVRIAALETEISHDRWWRGLSGPINLSAEQDGTPVDGMVLIEPERADGPSLSTRLTDGRATLDPERLDTLTPGEHRVRVLPDGDAGWLRVDTLTIRDPAIAVTPRIVPAHDEAVVDVAATGAGEPLAIDRLNVTGTRIVDQVTLGDHPRLRLAATPPGTVEVHVGRDASYEVQVQPRVRVDVTIRDGPTYELSLEHPNGTPVEDAAVRLDGRGLGFTNATGEMTLDALPEGPRTLVFQLADGSTVERPIRVDGWGVEARDAAFSLTAERASQLGTTELVVHVENTGEVHGRATLTALIEARPIGAELLDMAPGQTTTVHLPVPVESTGEHRIDLRLDRLTATPLDVDNATSSDDEAQAGGSGGGFAAGGPSETSETTTSEVTLEVQETVEDSVDAAESRVRQEASALTEPVYGRADAGAADAPAGAEETPAPELVLVLALVALAALAVRRR